MMLAALLFLIDISLATFFAQYLIATLLPLFCALLFVPNRSAQLTWVVFLLSCESLIFHGRFGLALIYLMPIMLITQCVRNMLLLPRALPYLTLLACIGAETLLIEHLVLGFPLVLSYTGIKICGSLIVQYLVLKYAF